MQNLGNILSINGNTTSIGVLIEILDAISIAFLITGNSNLVASNSSNLPISVRRLLIPSDNRAIESNGGIGQSDNATRANGLTLCRRLVNRQTAHVDVNAKVCCNVLKFEHCVSQGDCEVGVVEILAPKSITRTATNFLVRNAKVEGALGQSFCNTNQIVAIEKKCATNTKMYILIQYNFCKC